MVEKVFANWIHTTLEVYVDDMLVKSKKVEDHVDHLREIFEQMRQFNIKINPEKCIFGVASGKFLGYIVSKEGIEVDPEKVQVVHDMPLPTTVKDIKYEILSSPKSQVIADFLAEFSLEEDASVEEIMDRRWEILVDGSSNGEGNGVGIVFISPAGPRMACSFRLEFASTNNETEYEAVVHALRLAIEMKLDNVRITSDSQLVILQIEGTYNTNEPSLQKYNKLFAQLSSQIPKIN
ncbi:uncharacterized protein LOC113273075 [Papaver somniferum]|uniref:uncharacterized protein LOC113273075 n=1 Tax=Papaver somniferum TaxID=3469 RepID=UPI000E7010DD|nr:uncharacterized protein LOC113273075 [Papaver somniferum]